MAPLQKQVYKSILGQPICHYILVTTHLPLGHNLSLLNALTGPTKAGHTKGKLNNVLMELRKCLQHPYLHGVNFDAFSGYHSHQFPADTEIEPRGLGPEETHGKLIDGSTKLRFLKALLPKLKARGHRVLLFSQVLLRRLVMPSSANPHLSLSLP